MFSQEVISGKEVLTFDGIPLEGQGVSGVRSLGELLKDFKASAGKFTEFESGMSIREKSLFYGWIQSLRSTKGN